MTIPAPYRYDPTALRDVFERNFTLVSGFRRNVDRYGDRLAVADPATGRRWSYRELGEAVDDLAAGLAAAGVGRGDVVTFQLLNGPEFALAYLASQRIGAVASPINFRFAPGETAHVLDDSRPAAYLHDATVDARRALDMSTWQPPLVVTVPPPADAPAELPAPPAATTPLSGLLGTGADVPEGREASTWEEVTRLYTSGTTGMPKGVPLAALAEVLTAHDVCMHFPMGPEDRTLNMTPWFHRGGISPGGPNAAFYVGAAVVTMRQFDAGWCLDLVEELRLTYLIGAPTNLAMLADAQADKPRDLSSLRGVVTMGAPLERAACLRYQELLTPRIFNGYGTTETFWNTFLRPADLPAHAGSAGRACTDDDVVVVRSRADGPAEPTDTVARNGSDTGEVAVRSAKASYAYVNLPDASDRFRGGWMYTGDLATWDAEGYVTIVGRKDDMIISGGENVHPVQVEEVLNGHPGVADSLVVGVPDERWGQLVVAYVVPADPTVTAADCDAHCLASPMLSDFKRPRAYRFVAELPRTATGKKMHYRVREELAAGADRELVRPD